MLWARMDDAPKNREGVQFGPWIMAWSSWDHGIYQVRWEAKGEGGSWKARGIKSLPAAAHFEFWFHTPKNP